MLFFYYHYNYYVTLESFMFPYARVFEVTRGSVMKETFFQREEQVNNKTMWNSSHQERRTKRKFEF